jgi:YbbR domain-containing protein
MYKILAVFIAVFLWSFAHSEKTSEITLKIPILINNMPSDEVIINDIPRYLEVTLSGPSSAVFGYAQSKPVYRINLIKTDVGNYIFNVSPSEFNLPNGIKIETFYPNSINVSVDRIVSRTVDVGVSIVGNPPPNHEMKGIVTEPDRATIIGPSTIISNINVIMTIPVDISKFRNTITLMVPLSTANYKMVTVQPQAIVVIFKVKHS